MIKHLKYMFVAAIVMIAAAGCQEDWEDAFSKEPAAPELVNNGSILMTQNTMNETVTWAWTAARFMTGEVSYALYAQYGEATPVQVGTTTKSLSVSLPKTDLRTLLSGISGVPTNDSFDVNFYVTATDDNGSYNSDKQSVTVYAYGDAVSPVATASVSELVLDVNDPTGEVELLTWEAARLGYNEAITYNVYMTYGDAAPVEVAKDLTGTSCMKTVDEWNELAVSAGAPEAAASEVNLQVYAYSESYPNGVPSAVVKVKITTYVTTYPAMLYLPGSHQGWAPATAPGIPQSTLTKGLYEAFVDLTTEDGADVQFKFNPELGWNNVDFGGTDVVVSSDKGFAVVSGKTIGGDNVVVPSGFYRLSVNKKLNTFEMQQVNTVGLIGDATVGGWNEETKMTYDAETNTYSVVTVLTNGGGYKFRINDDWDYAIGDDGTFAGGNFTFEKETGEYKVVLDVNKHPYAVKVLSTSYPEKLYLPGNHQGWDPATAPTLQGDGEGHFEGGVNLVSSESSCQWKFSPKPAWDGDFGGVITLNESGAGNGTYGASDNIVVPNGYYYITVDMTAETFTMQRIDKVGLIGGFNSWGGDELFTYNATEDVWTLTYSLTAADEFKVRFNGGWDLNRGCGESPIAAGKTVAVYHNGDNMKVAEDGNYSITLDLSTNPNTIVFSK